MTNDYKLDTSDFDVIVIGGGQAGLSLGYYLRRTGLSYVILDGQEQAGGAWLHGWDSLRLFSPAQWSSLPGWLFPGSPERYPTRDEVVSYLAQYEDRYKLPVRRPISVVAVERVEDRFRVRTNTGDLNTRAVVSATGSWQRPYIPDYPGKDDFEGVQIHSANYRSPAQFAGKSVIVVGSGNSGAQIMAEVSGYADAVWVTMDEPQFLPDEVDGRVLFDRASEQYRALTVGAASNGPKDPLGQIVVVPPVKAARDRGSLQNRRPFRRFTKRGAVWDDGSELEADAVIWCTGFRPSLDHLRPLGVINDKGRVDTEGTRAKLVPNLWLVGYGNWTGFASATLIGVGRSSRRTVQEIEESLGESKSGGHD